MSLYALTRAVDISAAYAAFVKHFGTGCEALDREMTCVGGSEQVTVRWDPKLMFWVMTKPNKLTNRYWCAFGVENPNETDVLAITCEINPPHTGVDRQGAAVFVRSDNGTIYVAHSGGIGGGRPGIGKAAFLKYYGDETVDIVNWPDRQEFEYIIIGALDDDDLRSHVAAFVHKVAEFKSRTVRKVS
jgi:hypothetical protein